MSTVRADRDLLFGVLALQNDFIDRRALIFGFDVWKTDKRKPLPQILVEQGALTASRLALLEALTDEHLKQHGNDTAQSLAAVSSLKDVRQDLEQLADEDLH